MIFLSLVKLETGVISSYSLSTIHKKVFRAVDRRVSRQGDGGGGGVAEKKKTKLPNGGDKNVSQSQLKQDGGEADVYILAPCSGRNMNSDFFGLNSSQRF